MTEGWINSGMLLVIQSEAGTKLATKAVTQLSLLADISTHLNFPLLSPFIEVMVTSDCSSNMSPDMILNELPNFSKLITFLVPCITKTSVGGVSDCKYSTTSTTFLLSTSFCRKRLDKDKQRSFFVIGCFDSRVISPAISHFSAPVPCFERVRTRTEMLFGFTCK